MKTLFVLISVALCIGLVWGAVQGRENKKPDPTASTSAILTTETASQSSSHTSQSVVSTATDSRTELSEDGKEVLEKYEDYVINGIVFEMPMDDVRKVLGYVESTLYPDGSDMIVYRYGDIEIWSFPEMNEWVGYELAYVLTVHKGTYLGLTIGKDTREDAEKIFGTNENEDDYYFADPDGMAYSGFSRDGVSISVSYKDGIIMEISTSPQSDF
jgi:hypothetical protein